MRRVIAFCAAAQAPWWIGKWPALAVITVALVLAAGSAAAGLADIEKQLENRRLERLAEVQSAEGSTLSTFESDGCSAGLSEGWYYLAETFPDFKETFGDRPLWEHCCIAHDRDYWRGEVVGGYAKRLAADQRLRLCVIDSGRERSVELSDTVGVAPLIIEQAFVVAGDLMYKAVRVGGKPCTGFSWRWGYGWPDCSP